MTYKSSQNSNIPLAAAPGFAAAAPFVIAAAPFVIGAAIGVGVVAGIVWLLSDD